MNKQCLIKTFGQAVAEKVTMHARTKFYKCMGRVVALVLAGKKNHSELFVKRFDLILKFVQNNITFEFCGLCQHAVIQTGQNRSLFFCEKTLISLLKNSIIYSGSVLTYQAPSELSVRHAILHIEFIFNLKDRR
jgi:hypothetical protein